MPSYRSLTREEAERRRATLTVSSYAVTLDLASDDETFASRSVIRYTSRGGATFLDVKPETLRAATLDGRPLDTETWEQGRLPLPDAPGDHVLVVAATMRFGT